MSETSIAAGRPPRILIVDDVADNRDILARRFERRGYEILQADSGAQALQVIARDEVDIVLLDVVMPEIDGLEVLKRVRMTRSSVELPIIMVTGQAESQDIVAGLELGANDYITKPVDFAVASARVATQVGRRRAELALIEANRSLEDKVAQLRAAVLNAESANRAKSEFLANMSHEIRTPLNGVLGVAEALAYTSLDERQRELVGVVVSSGVLLERLLSDLLDTARIDAGQLEIRPQPVALDELVRATAALAEPGARAKGLDFEVVIGPEAGGVVELDPTRVSQILTNLLSNAVKFTAQGRITLEVSGLPGSRRFVVRDTGIGFGPEVKARLFQRFEQGDSSVTKRFGGSGLGLSISANLAEMMGGSLQGDAEPGRGAVFVFELPARASCLQAA